MSDNSISGIALKGIQTGMAGMKKNAANLASKDSMQGQGDPVKDLVEMKMNKYQVLASGKVIEAADEILGTLLDEKA